MSSGGGYEYRWKIWQDQSIVSEESRSRFQGQTCLLWEYRVNYMLKKRPGGRVLGSYYELLESHTIQFDWPHIPSDGDDDDEDVFRQTFSVLQLWGLPADEARRLVSDVRSLTHTMMMDMDNVGRDIFPMVVSLDICTVQKENESIESARWWAITQTDLRLLLDLAVDSSMVDVDELQEDDHRGSNLVDGLTMKTIHDDDEEVVLSECSICLKKPEDGDQVCFLPCKHGYHSNCFLQWRWMSDTCPLCRTPIS